MPDGSYSPSGSGSEGGRRVKGGQRSFTSADQVMPVDWITVFEMKLVVLAMLWTRSSGDVMTTTGVRRQVEVQVKIVLKCTMWEIDQVRFHMIWFVGQLMFSITVRLFLRRWMVI